MSESDWEIVHVRLEDNFRGFAVTREVWRRRCGVFKAVWETSLTKVVRYGWSAEVAEKRAKRETERQLGETVSDEFRVRTMEQHEAANV